MNVDNNENDSILHQLWLNIVCNHEPELIDKCIKNFGSASDIFLNDDTYNLFKSKLRMSLRIKLNRSLDSAVALRDECRDLGIKILSFESESYPDKLKEIYAPPRILYVLGDFPDFDKVLSFGIVGSRKCSEYSEKFSYELAYDIASVGGIIVSGMALGIDAAAHRGAIDSGNVTVAVLAGGVDVVYPSANRKLYEKIIGRGAVISERPPHEVGRRNFYRERNRIIVGLSNGIVVTEGEMSSGTKLTANWALSSNRDLFAVPGKPTDKGSELPNNLIKNSAKLITNAEDIVEEYIGIYPEAFKFGLDYIDESVRKNRNSDNRLIVSQDDILKRIPKVEKPDFSSFDDKSRIILEFLFKNKDEVHIDVISRECDIDVTELSFLIIQLLMAGVIKEHPGQYYSIK